MVKQLWCMQSNLLGGHVFWRPFLGPHLTTHHLNMVVRLRGVTNLGLVTYTGLQLIDLIMLLLASRAGLIQNLSISQQDLHNDYHLPCCKFSKLHFLIRHKASTLNIRKFVISIIAAKLDVKSDCCKPHTIGGQESETSVSPNAKWGRSKQTQVEGEQNEPQL